MTNKVLLLAGIVCLPLIAESKQAQQIIADTGVEGGLVVHIGCGDGELTAGLCASDSYMVHALDTDPANVERTRRHIQSRGLYGKVSVDRLRGRRLPYVDNLVNLIVAEDLGRISRDEVMRVLCPGGVAYLKDDGSWAKTVKLRSDEIDEW
ncbi:MAG: class I SAM-dependent methyltransferase, partial [Planctomycetota bacterium]